MGHSAKIVNLVRLHLRYDVEQVRGVAEVPIVEEKLQSSLMDRNMCWLQGFNMIMWTSYQVEFFTYAN